jgi:hypothetical protein
MDIFSTHEVKTSVKIPKYDLELNDRRKGERLLTTCCPCFCFLLQLKDHISPCFIILKVMDIVDDQDPRATSLVRRMKGHLL